MNTLRRRFLHLAIGSTALPMVSLIAGAQTYPSRPMSLIVFVPAGGTPDIIARLIGQSMSRQLGQPVVIDNRPGGGGNLALAAVARAPADGYTLLLVATPHAINVTLYEKNTVTVTRDIVPVASINQDSFVLLVNPSFPAKGVAEFISYAKANPGKIQHGLKRYRKLDPSLQRAVQDDDWHRRGARALSRHTGGAFSADGRGRASFLRRRWLVSPAHSVGFIARVRGNRH